MSKTFIENNENEWETISEQQNVHLTARLKIDGGYLYCRRDIHETYEIAMSNLVFVPDAPATQIDHKYIDVWIDEIAKLSMKINKMQSDLREFEKQRIHPIHDSIATLHITDGQLGSRLDKIETVRKNDGYLLDQLMEFMRNLKAQNENVHLMEACKHGRHPYRCELCL